MTKKLTTSLALILLFLALMIGAGLYFKEGANAPVVSPSPIKTEPVIEQPKRQEPITPPKQEVKSIPADWKTYRDEEYGFELKYPEGWQVDSADARKQGYDADGLYRIYNIAVNDKLMQTKDLDGIQYNDGIKIFVEKFDGDIQKFIEKKYVKSKFFDYVSQKQKIFPNGIQTIVVKYREPSAYDATWEIPLLYTSSAVFEFWQWPTSDDVDTKEKLNQILSTFRFLR